MRVLLSLPADPRGGEAVPQDLVEAVRPVRFEDRHPHPSGRLRVRSPARSGQGSQADSGLRGLLPLCAGDRSQQEAEQPVGHMVCYIGLPLHPPGGPGEVWQQGNVCMYCMYVLYVCICIPTRPYVYV